MSRLWINRASLTVWLAILAWMLWTNAQQTPVMRVAWPILWVVAVVAHIVHHRRYELRQQQAGKK
jgi:hypothetical protein